MPDISPIPLTRVSINEGITFLWKLKDAVEDVEFDLRRMVERRLPPLGPAAPLTPLVVNDARQDAVDEAQADQSFLEIKDMLDAFMQRFSGVEIKPKA